MFTYVIQGAPLSPVKIGRASDIDSRLRSLQTGSPHELRVLLVLEGDVESELHVRFKDDRINGEWFRWSKKIESFISEKNKCRPLSEVWHAVNVYCTNQQRDKFNSWHDKLYRSADAIQDWIRFKCLLSDEEIPKDLPRLMSLIGGVSWLEE